MPLQHARVDSSKPGLTLVDESGTAHSFTWAQVREYIRFDRDLRAGLISAVNLILPSGYALFIMLWNADDEHARTFIYQFSAFDPAMNSTTVRGAPFPNHLIDELDPPPAVPDFTPQRVRTIERMLWGSAECEARYLEHCDSMQDKCTEDRKRKRADHRAADGARASKAAAVSSTTGSMGVLAVAAGSGSLGSTTILSSAAARGSGSSGIATGLSLGSSAHSNTTPHREGSPMEEDKDTEGENDTELLSFSDDEGTDKKKARKGKKCSE
ncbi:hypothetical protein LXA43DRAFT_976817 [Ganoderma leucocontextum]|nr:hypothetical protein LXA43DRAFT_976817 [Ganoderma leucocontextum]